MGRYIQNLVKEAKASSYELAGLKTSLKDRTLLAMAKALMNEKNLILKENSKDIEKAKDQGLSKSLIDRLSLNDKRIKDMSLSLKEVARLPDPVGGVISSAVQPSGIRINKVRVPLGVVLIIYEARPNVTSDCAGLLFKASNIGILRGGGSAFYSNRAIGRVLEKACKKCGIKFPVFFVVEKPGHNIVDELLKQDEFIDLVIPRGGEALIRKVVQNSRIPVIKHYKGVCNIYVDSTFDTKKALRICVNAKVQRPSVCNAVENILVHKDSAVSFLPLLRKELEKFKVEIRGDNRAAAILKGIKKAKVSDWSTEYLDLTVSIKVVDSLEEAVSFINSYGSHHTDAIITKSTSSASKFTRRVDSACCFVNISTRFSDGYQFGMGAEIGISTDKLHARGPMGLEELTTYKYIAEGTGQIRE